MLQLIYQFSTINCYVVFIYLFIVVVIGISIGSSVVCAVVVTVGMNFKTVLR